MKGRQPGSRLSGNPFSPGFGTVPTSLVGRDDVLSDLYEGLAVGPADERFTSVILGVRGSGKTALLAEIEDQAASSGWVVLSVDGVADGLLGRVSEMIGQAARGHETPGLEELAVSRSKERTGGIKVGPYRAGWAETEMFDPVADMGLRERLTVMAGVAQQTGSAVLLTLDELHSANKDEARRLASDIQHITKKGQLPLAFVGAGLLEMKYTLMEGKKNTFFKRCHSYDVPPLTYADALQGLRSPIKEAGGTITAAALRRAASAVAGSPYKMQLIGHTAWKAAGAPASEVDDFAVGLAVESAEETMLRNISEPAFYDLSNDEQEYLIALVSLGDRGTTRAISEMTGRDERETRRTARRLELAGYIARDQHGPAALTSLVPREVVAREGGLDTTTALATADADAGDADFARLGRPGPRSAFPLKCRRWMPRARAHCVLSRGHSGRCRSR